jgi:preprotein translocase subunit SecB
MPPKKSVRVPFATLEIHGKLLRIVLDEVSFSTNRLASGTKGQASISAATEVGISDTGDNYFVSVSIEVQALSEEGQKPMYSIKVKGTGFYSVTEKITPEEAERICDQAAIRSNFQVYPEVRRVTLGLVAAAGYNLRLPLEPDFESTKLQDTKVKERAPAEA